VGAVPFCELGSGDVGRVGGKAAHLGDLLQAGFPVPDGFAVTTDAFDAVVGHRVDELVAAIDPRDVAALEHAAKHLREVVEALDVPTAIAGGIRAAYERLCAAVVAVRSSAVAEDAAETSFAGMQSTFLGVRGADDVLTAVQRCWASYFNAEALAYRARQGGAAGMSVAVQCMVDARAAGVMFTVNPVTGDRSSIVIDASYGVGAAVVGGEVTPDSFLYSKVTRELVRTQIGSKEIEYVGAVTRPVPPELRARACLEPDEVARVAELGRDVERHYGSPQDIEWAIDREGEVVLLQSRPVTAAAVAQAGEGRKSQKDRLAALYLDRRQLKL
jgi:pyruvate, water dikinase